MARIAILATNGFEFSELTEPQRMLKEAGHEVTVVSPEAGSIHGKTEDESVEVDQTLGEAEAERFDALVLPGGVKNPDTLRINDAAVEFIKTFVEADKPIAAICHGPWTLIEVGAVNGKTVTSWPSLKTDLKNAGATWVDEEVVTDGTLVTSRKPDDIPAFVEALKNLLST